ncbi:sensor histidine kinase [Nocardiopsis ansamitocini]|uniref:histidine kinase n=1 Tax=Nocardiopsis ansamitocini TaxID=1670832 RepID=A0A9W6UGN0_9ACTN|nr:nitrate- and nitrite sensing domain-containing protein [Nocardiopsis ansamitocini]GLU45752.1 histidine kinase [Nocardiopsis ansamitocini]
MKKEQRRSIRARLVALALIPSTALLALWIAITSVLVGDMVDLRRSAAFTDTIGMPVLSVITDLQAERRATMEYIAGDRTGRVDYRAGVQEARDRTDQTIDDFAGALGRVPDRALPSTAHSRIETFEDYLASLPLHRAAMDAIAPSRAGGSHPFDMAIEAGLLIWDVQVEISDPALSQQARSLTSLMRARELLSQEDALIVHAVTADSFTITDHADFSRAVGAQRYLYTQIAPELSPQERAAYDEVTGTAFYRTVRELENDVITGGPLQTGLPVNSQVWKNARVSVDLDFQRVERDQTDAVLEQGRQASVELMIGVVAVSTMALAVVVASLLFSLRVVRALGQRLNTLRDATLDYAHTRLPDITRRLRAGEQVDIVADAPMLSTGPRDEIGQVTEAFNLAQRAAVESAAEEARLRAGVRNVFRNVARRAQTLLHRQLGLLDTLEQSETQPAVLESLFKIDHLSTQMRRNADNLMLLTDDRTLVRRSEEPLPLGHAVRAASSEIEAYARVKLLTTTEAALRGPVAADVVRLLAELLDNATVFSPPHTPVMVRAEALSNGYYSLEVEDRGLGMTAEGYTEANELLKGTSEGFSLADMREDSRLGLIVIATLAQRHRLKVTLRPSPYNGTQAIVVLPPEVIAEPGTATAAPALPARLTESPTGPPPPAPTALMPARPATPAPRRSAPAPRTTAESTYKGLPRRVRGTKGTPDSAPAPQPDPVVERAPVRPHPPARERSLEEIRAMMSSFQQGTRHGRTGSGSDHHTTEGR